MKTTVKNVLIAGLATALLSLIAVACSPNENGDPGKLSAAVTIYPVEYFTAQVGGDRVEIVRLIPAGTDAHDFEPTPGDIRTIAESDVVLFNHPAFEGWILDAVEAAGSDVMPVQLAGELPALGGDGHDEAVDPHVWLNPVEAQAMVARVRDALSQADPDGAADYAANADALTQRLSTLDEQFSSTLASCQHSTFVASHLAYGHLAERYGLEQIGLAGLSDESESSPQQVAEVVDQIRDLGLTVILVEPFSNLGLAEAVASETGAKLLPLHPLESLTRGEVDAGDNYFTVMQRNLESLKVALDCSG